MNIMDNNTTYILPLDGIDLNYITTKSIFPNDGARLWDGSKHGSGEYYEVEIMVGKKLKSSDETENSNDFNDLMFHCQVCDISIPLGYKTQHNLSLKHKTCLKILEVAIDRTKKLLLATDGDLVEPASDSYFCEACAIAVMTSKRKEHDLSEAHLKSLQYDRLLNDLLKIYVEKNQLDNVNFENLTTGNKTCDKDNIESDSNVNSVSEYDDKDVNILNENKETSNNGNKDKNDEAHSNIDNISEFKVIESEDNESVNIKECLEKVDKDVEMLKGNKENDITGKKCENDVVSLKNYIEILNYNNHSSLAPKLDVKGDVLELKTSDDSIIYLTCDKFHGFEKINFIKYCILCNLAFDDESGHKMTQEHMKNVMAPISDMHGIRQFQGSLSRHCILCNDSVYNIDQHKTSDRHINIIRNEISRKNVVPNNEISQKNVVPKNDTLQKNVVPSNEISQNNVVPNNEISQNKVVLNNELSQKSVIPNNVTLQNNVVRNNNTSQKDDVPYNDTSLKNVVHKHEVWQKNYEIPQKTAAPSPSKMHCLPCDINIDTHHFDTESPKHKEKVALSTKTNEAQTLTPNNSMDTEKETSCAPCNIDLDTTKLSSHLKAQKHEATISSTGKESIIESGDENMNLKESLKKVDKDVDMLKENKETGKKGDNDVISLKDYVEMLNTNIHSSLAPKLAVKGDILELETTDKSIIYLTSDKFHGFGKWLERICCNLCLKFFTDENEHIMSQDHMEKVMAPISDMHGLRQLQGVSRQHCVLCNTWMCNSDTHKTSDRHINTLRDEISQKNVISKNNTPQKNVVPNNETSQKNIVQNNEQSRNVASNLSKKVEFSTKANEAPRATPNIIMDTEKEACGPSNINLDTNKLSSHLNGQSHKANITSAGKESDGRSTTSDRNELKIFCTTCNLFINTNQYPSHIEEKNHKSNLFTIKDIEEHVYSTTETGKICRICNVKVPPTEKNLSEHCRGRNHAINFETLLTKYKIRKVNNKLICGKCDKHFDVNSFLDHINTHDVKVTKKLRLCRTCNVQVPDTPQAIDLHKHSDIHKNNLKDFLHPHIYIVDNDDDFAICSVCGLKMGVSESKDHITSDSHIQEFNRLLRGNNALKRNDLFICTICFFVFDDEDKFLDHITFDDLHKDRRDSIKDQNSIDCIFCNVKVPYTEKSIEIHENSTQHGINFKSVSIQFTACSFRSGLNYNLYAYEVYHVSNTPRVRRVEYENP